MLNFGIAVRTAAGKACAMAYSVMTGGHIQGKQFILRSPSLLRVRGTLHIGKRVVIEKGARIVVGAGRSLTIGDDAYVGKNSTLIALDELEIGDRSLIGENVSIHTEDHGPVGNRDAYLRSPVRVGSDVWIGAGVVVLRGSSIGDGTTIGANAVVNKEIPSFVLAAGVPASVKRSI